MQKYLSPAELAIKAFGGARATAKALDREHSSVIRWRQRRMIPTSCIRQVYELAQARGLPLSAEDLILGREVS